MAQPVGIKWSEFTEGDEVQVGDESVGLRSGVNVRSKFPGTGVKDGNGNFLIKWESAGAVAPNSLKFLNSLTSNALRIEASGTDSVIDIHAVPKGGGQFLVPTTPTAPDAATSKAYVDGLVDGTEYFDGVTAASTANFLATYNNGTAGVGATLTATANGAANVDGVAILVGEFVLFKDQTATFQNGIYVLTTNGTGGTPSVYTRSIRFDAPDEIHVGNGVGVVFGATNTGTVWLQTATVTNIGADPIIFSSTGLFSAGASTDNAIARYDGVTGKIIQNSGVIISDTDSVTGMTQLDVDNLRLDSNTISSTDVDGDVDISPNGVGAFTINLGAVGIDEILDEDNMVSDSDTALSTQQSIKAYVDNSIGVVPVYRATLSVNQSISASTETKVEYDTETYDTNSNYDILIFRFTPTVLGKYIITASFQIENIAGNDIVRISIFKNGAVYSFKEVNYGGSRDINISVTDTVDMNGTTDFIEIFAFQADVGAENIISNASGFVTGFKIIE